MLTLFYLYHNGDEPRFVHLRTMPDLNGCEEPGSIEPLFGLF